MEDFNELLKHRWGSEQWILEGWNQINLEDKQYIKSRMDALFENGLPFEIKHDKLLYIYAFSLLAQLEVLAIQVPLKFKSHMISAENQQRMHNQLLDEIFHGLVFTKILYMLCDPYAMPPVYNNNVEKLCQFVREETCPKVAVMLLNLIAEGWIEEAFKSYAKNGIASRVFDVILMDENRHVCEADLYRDVGLPDMDVIKIKLGQLEEHLLFNFFSQHKYMLATSSLLGFEGASDFIISLDKKHQEQLKKIGLNPSKKWTSFTQIVRTLLPKIYQYSLTQQPIPMTPMRKLLMTQWDNCSDATMVSQCNIDVTPLDFFNKKFPNETLTTIMLQSISLWLHEDEIYRTYLHQNKLYRSQQAYVGVIAKLPGCNDQMGTIVFANCHELSVPELALRIRNCVQMMAYSYLKRAELEAQYPHLNAYDPELIHDFAQNIYGYCIPGSPIITVSNIGPWGYSFGKSPLLKNESMKLVLLEVERKQVWDKNIKQFVIQDHLPITISADHRVFDGNNPVPKILNTNFKRMHAAMEQNSSRLNTDSFDFSHYKKAIDHMLELHVEFAYKALNLFQTIWPDFFNPQDLLKPLKEMKQAAQNQPIMFCNNDA